MDFWKSCKPHIWAAGVLLGLVCLCVGGVQGQFAVIWKKAVMICMECIGIG